MFQMPTSSDMIATIFGCLAAMLSSLPFSWSPDSRPTVRMQTVARRHRAGQPIWQIEILCNHMCATQHTTLARGSGQRGGGSRLAALSVDKEHPFQPAFATFWGCRTLWGLATERLVRPEREAGELLAEENRTLTRPGATARGSSTRTLLLTSMAESIPAESQTVTSPAHT
jgi:hypothetical protein